MADDTDDVPELLRKQYEKTHGAAINLLLDAFNHQQIFDDKSDEEHQRQALENSLNFLRQNYRLLTIYEELVNTFPQVPELTGIVTEMKGEVTMADTLCYRTQGPTLLHARRYMEEIKKAWRDTPATELNARLNKRDYPIKEIACLHRDLRELGHQSSWIQAGEYQQEQRRLEEKWLSYFHTIIDIRYKSAANQRLVELSSELIVTPELKEKYGPKEIAAYHLMPMMSISGKALFLLDDGERAETFLEASKPIAAGHIPQEAENDYYFLLPNGLGKPGALRELMDAK